MSVRYESTLNMLRSENPLETLVEGKELESDISGDDSSDEDFNVDVNLQNASLSESSDCDVEDNSGNVIPMREAGSSRGSGRGRGQGRGNNVAGSSNEKYTSSSGILWTPMNLSSTAFTSGRTPARNTVTTASGPTSFPRRNIGTNPASAGRLMVSESMAKHIQSCTVAEARRQLRDDSNWHVTLEELDAFFALLYVRGALGHSKLCADDLWNKN
ncbi:uncharacterized protein LOC118191377 [Stegodyphus dumicola]|uniref:uncharacterized protein LOC118191377 n=1 Tax=Stegodyphus dumicola TaxID=202533 RepID=UPI0015A827BD|nr:uncharacterized protein LOC118191377 [Stegodyphus dumicola]